MNSRIYFYTASLLATSALFTAPSLAQTVKVAETSIQDAIIVTGVRGGKPRTVADSPAPIDVLSAEGFQRAGRAELGEALAAQLPSINFGTNIAGINSIVRPVSNRGMGPAYTLVLVNGKRRHNGALLTNGGGDTSGVNPVDLDLIPLSAVESFEVLKDSAAAQYGSDAVALAGCGPGGDDGSLVLGDQAGLLQAKLKAAGLLDNLPFPHSWANFGGAAPLFEAIAAGAVDTGPAGDTPTIMAASQQVPIRIVAAIRSGGSNLALLVPANSSIQQVQELRGRTVIVSSARGSIAHHLLLAALREAGVAPAEVKMGFMLPNDAAAAFEGGNVEAWATFGIYQAVAEVRGARVLRDGNGISSGIGLITASVKTLSSPAKRASVTAFLERLATANQWVLAHLDAYAAIYAEKTGVPLQVAQLVTRREDPRLQAADAGIVADLQKVADAFAAEGVLPAPVSIAGLIERGLFKA